MTSVFLGDFVIDVVVTLFLHQMISMLWHSRQIPIMFLHNFTRLLACMINVPSSCGANVSRIDVDVVVSSMCTRMLMLGCQASIML